MANIENYFAESHYSVRIILLGKRWTKCITQRVSTEKNEFIFERKKTVL